MQFLLLDLLADGPHGALHLEDLGFALLPELLHPPHLVGQQTARHFEGLTLGQGVPALVHALVEVRYQLFLLLPHLPDILQLLPILQPLEVTQVVVCIGKEGLFLLHVFFEFGS